MITAGHTIIDVPCNKLSTQELRHAKRDTPELFGTVVREIFLPGRKTPVFIKLQCDPYIQQTEIQQTSWGPDVNVTCVLTDDCRYVVTAIRDICAEQPLVQTEHRTDSFVRYDWAELATNRMMDIQHQLLGKLGEEQEKRQQLQEDLADKEQQLSQMSHTNSAQQEQLLRLTTRLTKLEQTVPASSVLQDQVQRMSTQLSKLEHAVKDSSSQQAADKQMVSIRDEHARLTSQMQVLQRDVHAAATQRLPKETQKMVRTCISHAFTEAARSFGDEQRPPKVPRQSQSMFSPFAPSTSHEGYVPTVPSYVPIDPRLPHASPTMNVAI